MSFATSSFGTAAFGFTPDAAIGATPLSLEQLQTVGAPTATISLSANIISLEQLQTIGTTTATITVSAIPSDLEQLQTITAVLVDYDPSNHERLVLIPAVPRTTTIGEE